jgi:ribosomal-protein-alanine N-acetyltransferase
MSIISTHRLTLMPTTPEFIELLLAEDYSRAGDLLNVSVPAGWPHDEAAQAGLHIHLQALHEDAGDLLWRIRLMVLREGRKVVGSINLKGPPRDNGDVEIGWGISAEHRRQGLAVEAARAVMEWVFSQEAVKRVIATIPEDNVASIKVAERLGMQRTEERKRDLPVWAVSREGV